jgi:alkanesulfonate monooxygenase SsuD/methylene tetrahydromethanopterin reductase-like flavin-dependent oxidoreductase (luciferase family)
VELAEWRKGRLVGTVEQVGEQVRRWQDLGVSSLVLNAGAVPFALAAADDVSLLVEACRV